MGFEQERLFESDYVGEDQGTILLAGCYSWPTGLFQPTVS